MKWSNRVQIVTGQTCLHIATHLLVIAALVGAGGLGMVLMPRNKVSLGNAAGATSATVGGKA